MKKLIFQDPSAQKIYDNYMNSVENAAKTLPRVDRTDISMEINSHLYEGLSNMKMGTEVEKILTLVTGLGDPYTFLRPAIAEKKLDQAVRTFNPRHLAMAVILNVKIGFKYAFFWILYLLLASFISLLFFKLIYPANTGLFYSGNNLNAFGFQANITGEREVLHGWFYPVLIGGIIIVYFILTLSLKFFRQVTKTPK